MAVPTGRLMGKVAIVTGSSDGIGRAIALAFAAHGTRLIVCADLQPNHESKYDQPGSTHEEICLRYGEGKAIFVAYNTNLEDTGNDDYLGMEVVVATAIRTTGRLDIVVNNSNYLYEGPLHEMNQQDWLRQINTNAGGAFNGCRHAIKQFLTQAEDAYGERGCIINVSSVGAMKGLFRCAAYCASTAAINGLTRGISIEYSSSGIRANALCPGYTETSMLQPWLDDPAMRQYFVDKIPSGRLAQPVDITGTAVWLASSAESHYVHGSTVVIDGGFHIK